MDALPLHDTIHFVLPADKDQPSGGNIYNEYLISALRKLGQEIAEISFEDYVKFLAEGKKAIFGVDSLFVNDLLSQKVNNHTGIFNFFILHHLQSLHPPEKQEGKSLFEQERKVLQQFNMILATSDFSRDYLHSKGLRTPVIVVEPALMPRSNSRCLPVSLPLRALMVANVVERKGVLAFLETLAELANKADDFLLTIVGRLDMEPDYFKECQRVLRHTFLNEKVKFTGALTHQQTLEEYQKHHLLVSAARMETFGMALQEARSLGLPLLVLEGGYSGMHVRGQNGKLCADIFELAGNFIQLGRTKEVLLKFLSAADKPQSGQVAYHWEQAAALFLQQIRNFL